MEAGKLDRRIEVQSLVAGAPNAMNETQGEWETFARIWAAIDQMMSSERIAAGQTAAAKTVIFIVRFRTDIEVDQNQAILYNGKRFDISSVVEYGGRRAFLRVTGLARAESGSAAA